MPLLILKIKMQENLDEIKLVAVEVQPHGGGSLRCCTAQL
jgi:hypothetical protein